MRKILITDGIEESLTGGEGGIRPPDRGVSPYNGLANRRLQPLGHLSVQIRIERTIIEPLKPRESSVASDHLGKDNLKLMCVSRPELV